MVRKVISRDEMNGAVLNMGGEPIELSHYATTGILALAVGPRGNGKTNAGLLMGEQLSNQGWVSVLIDPEEEMESLYGNAVKNEDDLRQQLKSRKNRIIVFPAKNAEEFVGYGKVILEAADLYRKPIFLMVDEGQLFSSGRKRKESTDHASGIINDFAERGRKRALDLFITAHRFSGTIHRSIFANKNLTFIGCQEDLAAWASLATQFRSTKIEYSDLNALSPGEFYCFSRRGVEKIKMPMAQALKKVAVAAKPVRKTLPTSFNQWSHAMQDIPSDRLQALTDPIINLLGSIAGLTSQQILSGYRALSDELEIREHA